MMIHDMYSVCEAIVLTGGDVQQQHGSSIGFEGEWCTVFYVLTRGIHGNLRALCFSHAILRSCEVRNPHLGPAAFRHHGAMSLGSSFFVSSTPSTCAFRASGCGRKGRATVQLLVRWGSAIKWETHSRLLCRHARFLSIFPLFFLIPQHDFCCVRLCYPRGNSVRPPLLFTFIFPTPECTCYFEAIS